MGHDHSTLKVTFGAPGQESEVTKVINVEANDQMKFVFDRPDIRQGDVVKGQVIFACHEPGQYEAGMRTEVTLGK